MEEYKQKSFWLSRINFNIKEPLQENMKTDIAILGGGFTGLSTAYYLKKYNPSINVTLIEKEIIGYGASGRNAGFSMTLFGFNLIITALRFGKKNAFNAYRYMDKAVHILKEFIIENKIECDYEHNGFFRVATTNAYKKRIQKEIKFAHSLGIQQIEWLDKKQLESEIYSPVFLGAWWEKNSGLLNPAKLAQGIKSIIEKKGVRIYEKTPAIKIKKDKRYIIKTPEGQIECDKVVFATNAYSLLFPQLRYKQVPIFTYIVLTEPLKEKHFKEIGWKNRQGIEDARNLVHYYRLTKDNRLLMGGRDISLTYGCNFNKDQHLNIFQQLEKDIIKTFPSLKDIKIEYRWGGPVSATLDFAPAIGFIGDKSAIYSIGCLGHGVSLTHLNGRTIAELLLEKETEETNIFFINRKIIPFPPEPIRYIVSSAIKGYLRWEDRILDTIYR